MKEKQDVRDYSEDMQKLYLQFMLSSPEAFSRSQNILKPEYWDEVLRSTAKFVLTYANENNVLPTPEVVKAHTGVNIEVIPSLEENHINWYLDEIEQFCRHKAMESLILDGPDLLKAANYGEIDRRAKDNMLISIQRDIGTVYFKNIGERLKRMQERSNMISTGWKTIDDKLYGGVERGGLLLFAGSSGAGKSLFLQNIAINWVQMGFNIVYITLELSEDLVAIRLDAMISGMTTKKIRSSIDEAELKIMSKYKTGHKWGELIIKKLPEGGTTCNDLKAYLNELEIQSGIRIDGIVVDYLDLLHPNNNRINAGDLFIKDKFVSEELRGLAGTMNLLCASASQLNRSAIQEQSPGAFNMSHIAGGLSKINTADNVIYIYASPAMKEQGEFMLQFIKTRSSSGVGQSIHLKYSPECMRITDFEEGERENFAKRNGVMSNQDIIQEVRNKTSANKKSAKNNKSEDTDDTPAPENKVEPPAKYDLSTIITSRDNTIQKFLSARNAVNK